MKKILLLFYPFLFIYDLFLSKINNRHIISNKSYYVMRYLYICSNGLFLFLISVFLKGFKTNIPSSKYENFDKHNILNSKSVEEISKSIFKIQIDNQEVLKEYVKFKDKNIDYDYYRKKNLVRLDFNSQDLVKNKSIADYATNPYWPNKVNEIIGTKPYLVGIDAWLTLPPPIEIKNYDDIGNYVTSQMWHRDCDKLRDIKVMTYLTDVKNENEGPFEIIKGTNGFKFFNPNKYKMGSSMRVENDFIQNKFKNSIFSFLGNKGETIIIDTRALHRGKKINTKNFYRLLIQLYFSNHLFGRPAYLNKPDKTWDSYQVWEDSFYRKDCNYKSLFNL